jgi:hypothetical protein
MKMYIGIFTEMCARIPVLVKIGQEYRTLHAPVRRLSNVTSLNVHASDASFSQKLQREK